MSVIYTDVGESGRLSCGDVGGGGRRVKSVQWCKPAW